MASWNESAVRLLGYQSEEIIGKKADVLFTEEDRRAGEPRDMTDMKQALEKVTSLNEKLNATIQTLGEVQSTL